MRRTAADRVATARRRKAANRWGCKPLEDVCLEHDTPLDCRHGCRAAKSHECKERLEAVNAELARLSWKLLGRPK